MEGKGIWDLIAKFALGKNEENKEIATTQIQPPLTQESAEPQPPLGKTTLSGSFLKSYNPFASPLIEKPQITSTRAEKPLRKSIDLNGSKNLVNGKSKDKTRNIIELINKQRRQHRYVL